MRLARGCPAQFRAPIAFVPAAASLQGAPGEEDEIADGEAP